MRKDLIDIVCCPEDKARLALEGEELDDHGDVLSGTLRCTQCGFGYPVEQGIPNLLPPEYHVPARGRSRSPKAASKRSDGSPGGKTAKASGAAKPPETSVAEREAVADET